MGQVKVEQGIYLNTYLDCTNGSCPSSASVVTGCVFSSALLKECIQFLPASFLVAYVCDSSSSTGFLPPTKLLRYLRDTCTLSQMACLAEYVSVMRRWLGDKLLSRRHARVTSKTINLEFERKSQVRCPIFVCNVDALASRRSQDVFYKPPQWDVLWRHLAF